MGKTKHVVDVTEDSEEQEEMFFSFHDAVDEEEPFENHNPLQKKRKSTGKKSRRRSSFGVAAAAANTVKKKKLAEKAIPATTNKLLRSQSALAAHKEVASASKALTKPLSPALHTDKRLHTVRPSTAPSGKRSEDLLMEKIQQERKQEQEKIERAQKMYQKLKANGFRESAKKPLSASTSGQPLVLKKPTIPQAPKSLLEQRMVARRVTATAAELSKQCSAPVVVKRASVLKKTVPVPAPQPARRTSTIPVPFHFASEKRAQQHAAPEVRDEQFVFKARALDKRIFEGRGTFGVPKIPVKPPTVPLDVELHSEKRALSPRRLEREREEREKLEREKEREVVTPFKARPVPATLREPEKLPTPPYKAQFQPTVAVSPKMQSGRASSAPPRRQRPPHTEVEKEKKARDSRQSIAHTPAATTQPQEFHFATAARSEKHRQTLLESERLRLEEEERQRAVKAQPLPDFHKVFVPKSSAKEPTVPHPFSLQSIQLHEESLLEFQREVEEERRREREAALIKAKTVPKTLYEPEHVEKEKDGERPVTVPIGMKLESNVRAKKRAEFDETLQQRMSEQERKEQEMEKMKEDKENRALKERRRKSVEEGGLQFKAKPVLTEDPYPVKGCAKAFEPTIPRSPKFLLKERRATKSNEVVAADADKSGKFRNF